jgi:DNA-binding transcriptional regulator YiaG
MNVIEQTCLTAPALAQLLNLDESLPPVTVDMVKAWRLGRYNPSPARQRQIEVVAEKRMELEQWLAGKK